MAATLLALAPQMAQASSGNENMSGLDEKGTVGSVPPKVQVQEEDDLDQQIATEEARQKQLDEQAKEQEEKRRRLEALKAENDKKEKTLGEKVGKETDRVFDQAAKQAERFAKHLRKKKF